MHRSTSSTHLNVPLKSGHFDGALLGVLGLDLEDGVRHGDHCVLVAVRDRAQPVGELLLDVRVALVRSVERQQLRERLRVLLLNLETKIINVAFKTLQNYKVSDYQLAPSGGLELWRQVLDLPHDVGDPDGDLVPEEVEGGLDAGRAAEVDEVLHGDGGGRVARVLGDQLTQLLLRGRLQGLLASAIAATRRR